MLTSQDIQRVNKRKMEKVGGQHAQRFLSDPKLNEHKVIGEKFTRKAFKSLAVDLYKSKLANNPMREAKAGVSSAAGADKENMPTIVSANERSRFEGGTSGRQNFAKAYLGATQEDGK